MSVEIHKRQTETAYLSGRGPVWLFDEMYKVRRSKLAKRL